MQLEFTDAQLQRDEEGGYWLSLRVERPFEAHRFLAKRRAKKYVAKFEEWRERRSLDANAYCWVLIGKIAAKVSTPENIVTPEEVYRDAIRDVGDNYEVLPIRKDALKRWKAIWCSNGTGWLCEEIGPSRIKGYINVRNFYGSSVYDKAQMQRLINNIVQDCKALEIETLTPEELARMTEEWK